MRRLWSVLAVLGVVALPVSAASLATASQGYHHDGLVSDNPANYTPDVLDGTVRAIVRVGSTVVLGGSFTTARDHDSAQTLVRNRLLAFDAMTGLLKEDFRPDLDGTVMALSAAPDGQSVFVGGSFKMIDGVVANRVAKLDISTGQQVPGFSPAAPNARVDDLDFVAGRLFVGGHFDTIGTVRRTGLAELDPSTGQVLPSLDVEIAGTQWGGTTHVYKLDVTPDGSRMVVIGNFVTVAGQDRTQVAMLDLTTNPARVAPWRTDRFKPKCGPKVDSIVRDVEFAPAGDFFVIVTTGGHIGGPPKLCDTISRWQTAATGSAVDPMWVDWTGGDSTYSAAVTDSAIYVGGHGRWLNNPFAANTPGPGAVSREGVAALDPRNGLPLSWNPGRTRGHGAEELYATADGLYMGSDTDRVNAERHGRVAFFPLAGGTPVPQPGPVPLPVDAYFLGATPAIHSTNVLYRVNAGGPSIATLDGGPDWLSDSATSSAQRNLGSTSGSYRTAVAIDSTVPGSTPRDVFLTDRFDPAPKPEMRWAFPVPSGREVQVRLYFANRSDETKTAGTRQFDVRIDGSVKLDNFDIVGSAGHQVGTMRAFDVTSDGIVNIFFGHVVNDPLINAIEIIDRAGTSSSSGASDIMQRGFDGSTVTPVTQHPDAEFSWAGARASTLIDGQLYSAWNDGHLYRRSFADGSVGPAVDIDLRGLSDFAGDLQYATGMFYDDGRLFYTRAGRSALYMRYLTVEADVIGARVFTVSGDVSGVEWAKVKGMFRAGSKLYWVNAVTGDLHRLPWVAGAPVAGAGKVVSGPTVDGTDWRAKSVVVAPAVAR